MQEEVTLATKALQDRLDAFLASRVLTAEDGGEEILAASGGRYAPLTD